jgi:hypothetical protein
VQVRKLLIMQSSPVSPPPLHLRFTYSSQHPVLKHPQVSHPHKTTGKTMILYISMFTFLKRRREDKRLWTER